MPRRLLAVAIVALGAATLLFGALRLSGDPALLFAGPDTTPEQLNAIRERWGFNEPLYVQYLSYLGRLLQGDLGMSLRYEQPVLSLVLSRLPATLQLAGGALGFAVVVGIVSGTVAARFRGRAVDQGVVAFSVLGQSIPPFWLGLLLILMFGVTLGWLPTFGHGTWRHLILPAVSLGMFFSSRVARLTRTALLDVYSQDYIKAATSKGAPGWTLLFVHAAKNAAIPVVTLLSVTLSELIGGSIVTETVFSWPGVGSLLVQGVLVRDYPLVQGTVLIVAGLVVVVTLATDLLYRLLDPRVRVGADSRMR